MCWTRRAVTAGGTLVLRLTCLRVAQAQRVNGPQCMFNPWVPPRVRSEGPTELVGDIVLNCAGGTPTPAGTVIPQADITITLNTQITSRVIGGGGEAILTVDEPTPSQAV